MESLPRKAQKIADIIDRIIQKMHASEVAGSIIIDGELSLAIQAVLEQAIDAEGGFKVSEIVSSVNYEGIDNQTRAAIQQNVSAFGVAKSILEIQEMGELMFDASGQLKSFANFRRDVNEKTHQLYNQNWLKTEYNHVIAASQGAVNYNRFQKDKEAMPYLTYRTAGDDRVRSSHRSLDGVTRPVDDTFWDVHFPPNDWGCRCDVIQTNDHTKITDQSLAESLGKDLKMKSMFQQNFAKSGKAFSDDHPNFEAAGDLYKFEAVKDYQMKTAQETLLAKNRFSNMGKAAAFDDAWKTLRKKRGHKDLDAVVLVDKNANLVLVEKGILKDSANHHLIEDVLSKPSEIWMHQERIVRIKYYKEGAQVAITDRSHKLLNYHYFDVDDKNIEFYRNGIIMHR